MKKKLIAAIMTVTLLITGCESVNVSAEQDEKIITVERGSYYAIFADNDTGVMYLYIRNYGGLAVMLNADGTPKIWHGKE